MTAARTAPEEPAPTVQEAWSRVMEAVQSVSKNSRNADQGFVFRGIDAVMNAVGPRLREHRVVVLPVQVDEVTRERYETKRGASMMGTTLRVTYRIVGPAGDTLEAQSIGEAADSGDKGISKAMSVAYRTLYLQGLCIPTDEPDPDATAHERAPASERLPAASERARRAQDAATEPPPPPPEQTPEWYQERYRQVYDTKTLVDLRSLWADVTAWLDVEFPHPLDATTKITLRDALLAQKDSLDEEPAP